MGRFVVHGILVEEPKRITTTNGIDCITLMVEEKVRTAYNKEIVNIYTIDFMGKGANCVPDNMRLIGCPVVVTGNIRSRQYNGRFYNDLNGDTLTIVNTSNYDTMPVHEDKGVAGVVGSNLEAIDVPADDDLPF